jgi:hypothetical protein
MIMILAFAVWSVLLAVVGVMTGVALLMYIAAALGVGAVGFAFLVMIVALRGPDPHARPFARNPASSPAAWSTVA